MGNTTNFLEMYNTQVEQDREKAIRDKINQAMANGRPHSYPFLQVDVKARDYKKGFHNLDNKNWVLLCDNHVGIVDKLACERTYQLADKTTEEIEQILVKKIIENLIKLNITKPVENRLDFVFNLKGVKDDGTERIYIDDEVALKIPKESKTDELKELLILFVAFYPKSLIVNPHDNTICFTSMRKSVHPEA